MLGVEIQMHTNIGELIVGVGTLALAVFTGRLAFETRKSVDSAGEELAAVKDQVSASQRQADAAQALAEAQERPFVVPSPPYVQVGTKPGPDAEPIIAPRSIGFFPKGTSFVFGVRLWNVGVGLAIVEGVWLYIDGGNDYSLLSGREIIVDSTTKVHDAFFDASMLSPFPDPGAEGRLVIVYRNAAGLAYKTTARVSFTVDYECAATNFVQDRTPGKVLDTP